MSQYTNSTNDYILCKSIHPIQISENPINHLCNQSSISSMIINNDSRIDTETHRITQICFSLAFCSTLIHLMFILYFKRIRQLYGICIVINCFFYSASYLMTLITCSLPKSNLTHTILSYLADYCILTNMIMNLKSSFMIVYLLMSRRENINCYHGNYSLCNSSHVCLKYIKKLCYIIGHITVIILPILCVVISMLLFETYNYISEDHEEFAIISCNLIPNYGHFYVFFPILFLLLLLQFCCILMITRLLMIGQQHQRTDNNDHHNIIITLWKTTNLRARYWITLKFTITHSLIWFIALLSIIKASISLWHVFTLLYSLQSIYITVNCIFTRPILDLLYQWHEEKIDYYKNDNHLLLINHNQQNDLKQDQIKNILINC
ncbi:unnamed protein product [Schistosoma rodhaini]|uniref:G_PROTEIN_RECEP_F1_2 domain-containing protein n=1 Tax=Schistosoma rodhaini TaxID=6188 RepID=A0AA85ESD1_9TREM|nr:unnamed protein product [Schistosoma rodhaini]